MPKVSETYTGKYLKASDLDDDGMQGTINGVESVEMNDGKTKLVASFENTDQLLVLNKTNATRLANAFGDDSDSWHGRKIQLLPDETNFRGDTVSCIRIRVPKKKAEPKPPQSETDDDDLDYE